MSEGRGALSAAFGRAMHGATPRIALALLGVVLLAVLAAPLLAPANPSVMSNIIADRALLVPPDEALPISILCLLAAP